MFAIKSNLGFYLLFLICFLMSAAYAEECNPPNIRSSSGAWTICRQWTPAETRHYAKWIENIYLMKTKGTVEQRTAKLEGILSDPEMNLLQNPLFSGESANPQLSADIMRSMHYLMDCGTFTAFMPAYYAYRRALPWMTAVVTSGGGDIRTAAFTIPVESIDNFSSKSLDAFFKNAIGSFISGNYRVNLEGRNAHLSDTVPVAITPKSLMPGCINYIDGHCLLLAHVSEYGELYFLNCSTTYTHDIFSYNGMNTVSGITPTRDRLENPREGCFQGLRVFRYPIAVTDSNGQVLQVRRRTNDEMKQFGFSTEQYDMVREITRQQCITIGRLTVESFHDFIRLRMKRVDSVAPLAFMENYADELLDAYIFRAQFVQDSWTDVCAHGPITYPEERSKENIFQALGRWETWSSPSSDIDRRNKYFYLADWLEYVIRLFRVIPGFVDLAGLEKYGIQSQGALAKALIAEKQRIFSERSMAYTNSKGKQLRLTLGDIEERLYDLSFDPNHPPELRWGAPIDSEERASAPNTVTPVPTGEKIDMEDAYRWQRYYRCIGTRETDMSCLQGMFTTGFVIRDKLDRQLSKWIDVVENITPGIGSNMEATSSAPILSQPSLPASEKLPAVPVAAKPVIQIEKEIHRPRRGISKKLLPPKRALPMRRPVRARNAH